MTRQLIGERLRCVRLLRQVTQVELAGAAGVCKEVVCRTERGDREMAYHEAVAYARILCFCLNAFGRTEADGRWDITACLLPYTPPARG
ncbi:MAG: helix-turn-helix transcriptional regulator [Flavobacteriales bacterium]